MHLKFKHIATALFIFICTGYSAQVTAGIKAGGGTGNLRIDQENLEGVISGESIVGLEFGAFLDIDLNGLYVRPEALYLYRYGTVTYDESSNISIHRVQFPIMIGIQLVGPLAIEGGPTYSRILRVDHSFEENITLQKNGFGYRVGPVLRFNRLLIYTNYEGNVISTGSGSRLEEPFRLNFGIGLKLGGGEPE